MLPALEPATVGGHRDVRPLAALLDQPVAALARCPAATVWQCSVRAAPGDRRLSDAEWADVAREVLHRTGLAPRSDEAACRWVAVRHAEDHIHIAVTLARQDGRPARASHDFLRVREACRAMEQQHGLTSTAASSTVAVRRPTRGELGKAQRQRRRETPREALRREVRVAAAGASDPVAFVNRLRAQGVLVRERRSDGDPAQLTGYAVAWPGDRTRDGQPVWFSGGKLAADLSLPRLTAQWAPATGQPPPATASADLDVQTRGTSRPGGPADQPGAWRGAA